MLYRSIFIFYLLFYSFAQAVCTDPVKNEYIIVTKHPDLVLSHLDFQIKKLSSSDYFIYNHQNSRPFNTSSDFKIPLDESTLVLNLSPDELLKIKKTKDTSAIQNCYINLEDTVLGANEVLTKKTTHPMDQLDLSINDPLYELQWGHKYLEVGLPQGAYKSIIAVSDTGFDTSHEDLKNNLWINHSEFIGATGQDDDGNGCVDDLYGCDVADLDGDVGINFFKESLIDHGTHVAGIISAQRNNNLGIAGASLNSKVMLIKAFSSHRKTTSKDLIKSIYYAVDNGADIINCSWGTGSKPTLAEFNAFEYARLNDVIAITAAGNNATFASKTSPAGLTNVLTVGSHTSNLELSTFSNLGASVDILAPGGDGYERKNEFIMSLTVDSKYIEKKGTSMSAPFISSVLGNLKSHYPNLSRNELLNLLILSADKKDVQGFFDTNYKDQLLFLNQKNAFDLAEKYLNNSLTIKNLDYEPKKIEKPNAASNLGVSHQQETSAGVNPQGSGCSNKSLETKAMHTSIFLILLPILILLAFRKSLKKKEPFS